MSRVLALTSLLAMAGVARADEGVKSIFLECRAPASWSVHSGAPVRLTCRIDAGAPRGPAYWETVNPFEPAAELVDPFEVEATPRFVDIFEVGRYARPRAERPLLPRLDQPSATIDPFEDPPAKEPAPSAR